MNITKELYEELKRLRTSELDAQGRELLNPLPMEIPVTPRPPTLQQRIQRLMRVELSRQAAMQGYETFDEANDFDVEDDFDVDEPISMHEVKLMMEEEPQKFEKIMDYIDDRQEAQRRGAKKAEVEEKTDESDGDPEIPVNEGVEGE